MQKYHKLLVESKRNRRVGNHRVEVFGKARYYYYHGHLVCHVDEVGDYPTFELDACGYSGYRSTKMCLAGYREYYSNKGYKEINPIKIFKYEEDQK